MKASKTLRGTGPKAKGAPRFNLLMKWCEDGVAKSVDGCTVEPDGRCPHGSPSWLLELGLI